MIMSPARLRWLYLRGAFLVIGVIFTLAGVVLGLIAAYLWQREAAFHRQAVRAVATVTGKEQRLESTGKGGKRNVFILKYTFPDAAGRQHEGEARVSQDQWRRANPGDPLDVEYAANNPGDNRAVGESAEGLWVIWLLLGIGALFGSLGIVFLGYALVQSGRRARLVREGTPALGTVDAVVKDDGAVKVKGNYRLAYHFTDNEGNTWEGRGPSQPWSLAARWNPGETILVLYDPRDPRRNEADVFEARSDDLDELQGQAGD